MEAKVRGYLYVPLPGNAGSKHQRHIHQSPCQSLHSPQLIASRLKYVSYPFQMIKPYIETTGVQGFFGLVLGKVFTS